MVPVKDCWSTEDSEEEGLSPSSVTREVAQVAALEVDRLSQKPRTPLFEDSVSSKVARRLTATSRGDGVAINSGISVLLAEDRLTSGRASGSITSRLEETD